MRVKSVKASAVLLVYAGEAEQLQEAFIREPPLRLGIGERQHFAALAIALEGLGERFVC